MWWACSPLRLKYPKEKVYVPSSLAHHPSKNGAIGSPVFGTGANGMRIPFPKRELSGTGVCAADGVAIAIAKSAIEILRSMRLFLSVPEIVS